MGKLNDKVTVEISRETAEYYRDMNWRSPDTSREMSEACAKALGPEYEDGTIAWVTYLRGSGTYRRLCNFDVDGWKMGGGGYLPSDGITKVEIISVLKDGEVAVSASVSPLILCEVAKELEGFGYSNTPHWLREVAKKLEK